MQLSLLECGSAHEGWIGCRSIKALFTTCPHHNTSVAQQQQQQREASLGLSTRVAWYYCVT